MNGYLALKFDDAETIAIGLEIAIKVHLSQGRKRKLIICAPKEVTILRSNVNLRTVVDDEEVDLETDCEADEQNALDDYGNLVLTLKPGESINFSVAGEHIGSVVMVKNYPTTVRLALNFVGGKEGSYKIRREKFILQDYGTVPPEHMSNKLLRRLIAEAA